MPDTAQSAVTPSHSWGTVNNTQSFLTVQEAAKSKITELADLTSGKGPLSVQKGCFLLCLCRVAGAGPLCSLFLKGLANPKGPTS